MIIKYKSIIYNNCDYMQKLIASNNHTIYGVMLTKSDIKNWINKGHSIAIYKYGKVSL